MPKIKAESLFQEIPPPGMAQNVLPSALNYSDYTTGTATYAIPKWTHPHHVTSCRQRDSATGVRRDAPPVVRGCQLESVAMRDLASKMAELKFEAPLAQFEETDEWGSTEFQNNTTAAHLNAHLKNENEIKNINLNKKNKELSDVLMKDFGEDVLLDNSNVEILLKKSDGSVADNFTETFSGSLEDLVNTFDEKITKCFGNYEESVEKLAPVQVRTQEEIMNECQ